MIRQANSASDFKIKKRPLFIRTCVKMFAGKKENPVLLTNQKGLWHLADIT